MLPTCLPTAASVTTRCAAIALLAVLALLVGELLAPLDDTTLTLLMAVPTAAAAIWVVATGRLTHVTQQLR